MTQIDDIDIFRTFGFIVIRQFFDAGPLTDEIDRAMSIGLSQEVSEFGGIQFQYVPMMTAETPASLSLLDRAATLAARLPGGSVLPTRAKRVRYAGNTPWHPDSESPISSIGFIAYLESLRAENGALRVLPGSQCKEYGDAIRTSFAGKMIPATALPAHVIETDPGDLIVINEHLFHASAGGTLRRQWRVDYLPVPVNDPTERQTKDYFEAIYAPDWDGGYDADRYPSYGSDWRNSGRHAAAQLERLGVYDLAARQEASNRSKKRPY